MKEDYQCCLNYIEKYWKKITFHLTKDNGIFIGLPNRFVSPSAKWYNKFQFYWDSYFIILGLVASGKITLAKGIVDNFSYCYKNFEIMPHANRLYYLTDSQPPFFTSMIKEIFNITKDEEWVKENVKIAEAELENYWHGEDHNTHNNLSRYHHPFDMQLLAEMESGWDLTSRFNESCSDYLSIDLNSCLYKYETDIAEIYKFLKNKSKEKMFLEKAKNRKRRMLKFMWNDKKGFFFDYNYKLKKKSNFYSLAGFYPLWAKLASENQAEKIRKNLKMFECKGGLANTQKNNISNEFKQWDYPNGWPNQQWIVIKGLLNYGFNKDAERLAIKWLNLNKKVFNKTGKFWEKYNVVKSDVGKSGRYPTVEGFGWTNAVFVKLVKEFCI